MNLGAMTDAFLLPASNALHTVGSRLSRSSTYRPCTAAALSLPLAGCSSSTMAGVGCAVLLAASGTALILKRRVWNPIQENKRRRAAELEFRSTSELDFRNAHLQEKIKVDSR